MRDKIHEAVKKALINDVWKISADPFYLLLDGTTIEIDLEAEKNNLTTSKLKIIFIEVKTISKSALYDCYNAYGQYEFYREALEEQEIGHPIFLAISTEAFEKIKKVPVLYNWLKKHKVNLIVVNITIQMIKQWIKY